MRVKTEVELGDPVRHRGTTYRVKHLVDRHGQVHIREHFKPNREAMIDIDRFVWDNVAGLWRVR